MTITTFFDLIKNRHSIRSFKNDELSRDILEKILDSAIRAPSAGNLQSYKIFVITDESDKFNLSLAAHNQDFIKNAPVVLVFCADPTISSKEYGKRGEELFCIQDATLACCYAQLATHVLGLSSVWVGAFDEDMVKQSINIDTSLKPTSLLVIGHAAEKPELTTRRSIREIVQEGKSDTK